MSTPRWLAAAFAATFLLAAACVYLTFCLLFWQGQWQLAFQPSHTVTSTPAAVGLSYQDVQFDATETGVLQLRGWWVPGDPNVRTTLLLLHDGIGSLSSTLPQLRALHSTGFNVFVFDYRGFGQSVDMHPSEASTYEDADAAWNYLTGTRHIAAAELALDGVGLGAAIAAETARRHPEAAALILEAPRPPLLESLQFNPQTRLLPIRLLFHDRFDPTAALARLTLPKLFVNALPRYYEVAAAPKKAVTLPIGYVNSHHDSEYRDCVKSFLTHEEF